MLVSIMKEWLCPNCKRLLHAEDMDASRVTIVGVTGQKSCKFCGYAPILEFTKIKEKDLAKSVKEFHKRTGF